MHIILEIRHLLIKVTELPELDSRHSLAACKALYSQRGQGCPYFKLLLRDPNCSCLEHSEGKGLMWPFVSFTGIAFVKLINFASSNKPFE